MESLIVKDNNEMEKIHRRTMNKVYYFVLSILENRNKQNKKKLAAWSEGSKRFRTVSPQTNLGPSDKG